MTLPARARYSGYRFPAEIIGHAVWLYFRFPLGLRMVEELLAGRGADRVARTIAGALGAGEPAKVVNLRDGRQSK